MNEYLSSVNILSSKLDRLESIIASRKDFLSAQLINEHGVVVVEGLEMGISVTVRRVGTDSDGKYAIVEMNGTQMKVGLNQIVNIQHTLSPV